MTYSALFRAFWNRVLYGTSPNEVQAKVEVDVHIQQQLEGAVTYVAEFKPTGFQMSILDQGQEIVIDKIDLVPTEDTYQTRRVFTGVVDPRTAAAHPNEVSVRCSGNLRKLRKTRQTDYSLTGKTDTQVVKDILTYCGITYDDANIAGEGYTLGAIKDLTWKKQQSGIELLEELDNVFGYATIELGDGTVMRFPYSKVPSEYSNTIYGTTGVVKNYRKGTVGLTFYDNEREYGSMDDIINHWSVLGVAWEGEEDAPDEGCSYQIWAEGVADSSVLGEDVYQSDELQSDFIQSEEMAKKICARLMRWYNRPSDTIRIEAGNDPVVGVGHLIGVRDNAYGIELDTTKRYLVTATSRDGDFMTIDCIGGDPGSEGTLTSGIKKCCGTELEDGTCDETGTDPGTPDPGSPTIPDIPPIDICDPLTNVNCIPDVDPEVPDDDNLIDPLIGCTTEGSFVICDPESPQYDECIQTTFVEGCTGTAPSNICQVSDNGNDWFAREETDSGAGYSCECEVHVPWRTFSGTPFFHRTVTGNVDIVAAISSAVSGNTSLSWSTVTDPDAQDISTDVVLGAPLVHSVSGIVEFNAPGSIFQVLIFTKSGTGYGSLTGSVLTIYADPGQAIAPVGCGDVFNIGVQIGSHNNGAIAIGCNADPNQSLGGLERNNGGYLLDSSPAAMGQGVAFNVSFDESYDGGNGRTTVSTSLGGGHVELLKYLDPSNPVPGEPAEWTNHCADLHGDGHFLVLRMIPGTGGDFDAPAVLLRNLVVGHTTCEENPNYVEDIEDDGV